mmetsp:Transcript_156320/g.271975  ORF Transcript_156320/g.271975 Transcript_156320/m.271975 type:complete len:296 (-) Transcript_156320:257-1144(-)
MSFPKFALIALCCQAAQLCMASMVDDEDGECAAFPEGMDSAGNHVMLQHSESHRVGINEVSGSSESKKAMGTAPCNCEIANPAWKPCPRTTAKCVFIDLGAADGNTFKVFLQNGYTTISNCTANGPGAWEAILVEANPKFDQALKAEASKYPYGYVAAMTSTAAYSCEGKTSFFVDTVNTAENNWGSSMSQNHPDVLRSGKQNVTVPTMNLNRLLYELTIPADKVILKMDIEGAEFDVLPCLAQSPSSNLVDMFYLEQHQADWGNIGTTVTDMETHKATLRSRGVIIPEYFSHTL